MKVAVNFYIEVQFVFFTLILYSRRNNAGVATQKIGKNRRVPVLNLKYALAFVFFSVYFGFPVLSVFFGVY